MNRRQFIKRSTMAAAAVALLPGNLPVQAAKAAAPASSGAIGTGASKTSGKVPAWVKSMRESDMDGLGPDGKPDPNYRATGTGSSVGTKDPQKPHKMKLTKEEQGILDGKEGETKAKVMKTVVAFGNAFGATKLVKLGGAPHTSLYNAPQFMEPMIKVFEKCADEGLKSYAPFTVNPRPYDLYNVQNSPHDMAMVFEGYPLQPRLEYVLMRLGARDFNSRSCMCFLPEIGNKPEPGTMVAWAESSATNFGNSGLGIRTNRLACGMELMCALVGKAPYFGLMTDEGRMATWVIDVKTTKEPDWGVLGAAIGIKVTEDVPFIVGIDKYFGGEITGENMHKLKAMGASTAANGAVGLYHVENVTPDAKEKGRKLLAKGYKTYVVDDKEIKRIYDEFPNLWGKKDAKPTRLFLGCPHNTYHEVVTWGRMITEELKKRGQDKVALPIHMFVSIPVRNHVLDDHPVLVRDMKRAGMNFTNMCTLMFTGLKGFGEREFPVTNSNKTRKYSSTRYFPDDVLLEIAMTGEIPKGAEVA